MKTSEGRRRAHSILPAPMADPVTVLPLQEKVIVNQACEVATKSPINVTDLAIETTGQHYSETSKRLGSRRSSI